jgi:hypothetical protein
LENIELERTFGGMPEPGGAITAWERPMIRQFAFEWEIYQNLECLPMTVKRKLDRIALKIGRQQWVAMGRGERLAICHLPADTEEECAALSLFVTDLIKRQGAAPMILPESVRKLAAPPDELPDAVLTSARDAGFALDQHLWNGLDAEQRYALTKLTDVGKKNKLARALAEFFPEPRERPESIQVHSQSRD